MPPGSPNLFKPNIGRNLARVFPPPIGGFEVPQILSGVVNPVHDFPGTLPYLDLSMFDNIGAADVTLISTAVTPADGFIWLIDELSILVNDANAGRRFRLYLTYAGVTVTLMAGTSDGSVAIMPIPLGRRIVLVPNGQLSLTCNALTAGANLRFSFAYLNLPAGQFVAKN